MKRSAQNLILGQSRDSLPSADSPSRLRCIPKFNFRLSVPVSTVALNQQVKARGIQIKYITFIRAVYLELRQDVNTFVYQRFSDLTLDTCFPLASTVATKRAVPPAHPSFRCVQRKQTVADFAVARYGWLMCAGKRAVSVALSIRQRNGKQIQALRATLFNATAPTLRRTSCVRLSTALTVREFTRTVSAGERAVSVTPPPLLNRAGTAVRTAEFPRRRSTMSLFAAIATSVSVLISQDVNLIDRLAFRSEPLGRLRTSAACSF